MRAFNERGLMHERKGDLDLALADFDAALKVNPRFDHARNNRGLVLARQGKFEAAIAEYGEALRIEPDYMLAYLNRGARPRGEGPIRQGARRLQAAQPR